MKKKMKRFFASVLAFAMMFSTLTFTSAAAEDEYQMFLAIGADAEADGDWGYQYYGNGASSNAGDVTATDATAKVGDTVTIGVSFPTEVVYTWFMAPVLVAENAGNVDYTIDSVKIDGEDVTDKIDFSAGKAFWYEGTGDYSDTQAVRLAGGYNEWGDKYMTESPKGFKEITYTITLNAVEEGAAAGEATLSEESYDAFIAIGADKEADGDWGYNYAGEDAEGITATTGTLKSGETTTLSLEFDNPVVYTWYVAPCMIMDDATTLSDQSTFDVKVYLDGEEVTTDLSVGKACWAEGTGAYDETKCVRIGGGYNEWGDKYLAESPKGYKTITFEITPQIYVAAAAEETSSVAPVDLNGTYNAYIGIQTPNWSFRNAYDDATYGLGTDYFNQITGWDADNNAVTIPGNIHDTVISGNGTYTVSIDGLSFPDGEFSTQEYLNLIFISTDIPNSGEITFSDVTLTVDGKNVDLPNGAVLDPDSKEVTKVLLQNIWNNDCKEIGYYAVPMTDISITFTVSGFAYDNEASAETTETVVESTPAETTPAEETGSSNTGLIVGIVVAAVVVIGGVVAGVVVSKKKKAN